MVRKNLPTRQEKNMANQGGNREQHVKAGQQSRKNTGDEDRRRGSGGEQQRDDDRRGQQQADDKQRGGQQRGGSGNFADDREKASEAGRKGGQS
ncbi:KGG domain-containing protein [Mesorhizobium sp.]|uniref:KGG domain-containing protein n=2 Tax=Mesorhizobium sp. TaxID=1871066 RepID=UPI00345A2CBC